MTVEKILTEDSKPHHEVRIVNDNGVRKVEMYKENELVAEVTIPNATLEKCVHEARLWLNSIQML